MHISYPCIKPQILNYFLQLDCDYCVSSMDGLFLLSRPEGEESASGDLDDLESDSWDISLGVTRSTESGDEDLIIFLNETHTTISGHVSCDSLIILLKLNSHALSHGWIWLFGFDSNLLDDDTSGVGSFLERFLPFWSGVLFLVTQISPPKK